MIVVNGKEYRTLADELTVNGKKVYEAYANGKLVYPDAGVDPYHIWVIVKGEVSTGLPTEDYILHNRDKFNEFTASVNAKVTWVMRFESRGFEFESLTRWSSDSKRLMFSSKNYEDKYVIPECWNIVELDFTDNGRFEYVRVYSDIFVSSYQNDTVMSRADVVSMGALNRFNDTYTFKRVSRTGTESQTNKKYFYGFGMTNITLMGFGDVGITGVYSSDIPLESIAALILYFNNFESGSDGDIDVDVYTVNTDNDTSIQYDKTVLRAFLRPLGINVRQAYDLEFLEVHPTMEYYFGYEVGQHQQGFADRTFSVVPDEVEILYPGDDIPSEYLNLVDVGEYGEE